MINEVDSEKVATHYNLPPEFFRSFLGPRMAYSCAYFEDESDSLAKAEENKLRLTSEKLRLKPGESLVDIGSGWGSMLFYTAEKYGCHSTGMTVAGEQMAFVNDQAKKTKQASKVRSVLMDAYEIDLPISSFDKAVSIGAIEHMQDLDIVFQNVNRILKDDSLFLVHGMTLPWESRKRDKAGFESETGMLVKKHFGIGHWHSLHEVIEDLEKSGFEIIDVENITRHYHLTTARWLENLQNKEEEIAGKLISEKKYREFLAFLAGYSVCFEFDGPQCQQILCQKFIAGEPRGISPLVRRFSL